MKVFYKILLTAGISLLSHALMNPAIAQAPASLTPADWRSDLQYFKNLVHTKYSNLFYTISARQFDSVVAGIDKKIGKLDDVSMRIEFLKLVALFQVGHTETWFNYGKEGKYTYWVHRIPVNFYLFSDGLYIKSIPSQYAEALGGKVTKIGKASADMALEKIRPFVSFENEQGFKSNFPFYLNIPEFLQSAGIIDDPSQVTIAYWKDGKEKTITLKSGEIVPRTGHTRYQVSPGWVDAYPHLNTDQSVLWLKKADRLRYFEYLPESKTVYVRHSAVLNEKDETIEEFFARVFDFVDKNEVEKFILDIRLNGGGNNYLNKPVITGIIAARKINKTGRLFVITGRETFSAAQNLSNELEKYTEAIFVGEPTSENVNFFGDTRTETLPRSQLNINLSWLWWQNLDPRDKRKWKAPHLAADLSFADYQNGVDPSMSLVMNYDQKGPVDNTLRDLVMKGQFDEAVRVAREYIQDPVHRYYKDELEGRINEYGYSLISQQKYELASRVLYMNVELFPGSANVYDSYAESLWKLGKNEEAIKYYNLAIEKDPHGETGENARRMLAQIRAGKVKSF